MLDVQQQLLADCLHGLRGERPAGDTRSAAAANGRVARAARASGAASVDDALVGEDAPVGLDLGHCLRTGRPAQDGGEDTPGVLPCLFGDAVAHHLFAPRPWRQRLVEAHRGHGGQGHRVADRWARLTARLTGRLAEEMAVGSRHVPLVGGGREASLVARVGVDCEVELDHLPDAPRLSPVGLLRVEVQQEPPQAVRPPALGRDVVVHPGAGVADRGEGPCALDLLVVVEADRVGAPAALGDVGPGRPLPPRPSHRPLHSGARSASGLRASIRTPCPASLALPMIGRSNRQSAVSRRGSPRTGHHGPPCLQAKCPGGPVSS
jgi:hypothetical protein